MYSIIAVKILQDNAVTQTMLDGLTVKVIVLQCKYPIVYVTEMMKMVDNRPGYSIIKWVSFLWLTV